MNKEQKRRWNRTLIETEKFPYDFIYFIDTLDNIDNASEQQLFIKELTEFRNDSRYLMKKWLKSIKKRGKKNETV